MKKARALLLAVAVTIAPVSVAGQELSFDQTRVCLNVANSAEELALLIDGIRNYNAAEQIDILSFDRLLERVETTARNLFVISRDSEYLVPWHQVDAFAASQRFSGGYLSGPRIGEAAMLIRLETEQLRAEIRSPGDINVSGANKIVDMIGQLGVSSKIREMCGKLFLGTS